MLKASGRAVVRGMGHAVLVLMVLLITCSAAVDGPSTKGMKVPIFSGKDEEWQMWWMAFCTFATIHASAME